MYNYKKRIKTEAEIHTKPFCCFILQFSPRVLMHDSNTLLLTLCNQGYIIRCLDDEQAEKINLPEYGIATSGDFDFRCCPRIAAESPSATALF